MQPTEMKRDLPAPNQALHGKWTAPSTRPLASSIVPSSVFSVDSIESLQAVCGGKEAGFLYARGAHPNQSELEGLVARLEGALAALACSSGMAALTAALFASIQPGGRIVADAALYSRTHTLIAGPLRSLGASPTFANLGDNEVVGRALVEPVSAVLVESISNPFLTVPDLRQLAALTHSAGGVLIVDNTVATPYHCRPLEHGADIVVHSGSKYLGGHSDTMSGVLVGNTDIVARARDVMVTLGSPAAPFDCWLTSRGLKTLAIRMARAAANAEQVAAFCASRDRGVRRVHYPGLTSHPQHERAFAQLDHGFGAMIALDLSGNEPAASAFVRALRWIPLAPSFGDVGTTIAYPAAMQDGTEGLVSSVGPGLLRLSVGIEDASDIIADLELGFRAAEAAGGCG
jgi:cystathionine beta-lyase/cystathionine gamma-synthase